MSRRGFEQELERWSRRALGGLTGLVLIASVALPAGPAAASVTADSGASAARADRKAGKLTISISGLPPKQAPRLKIEGPRLSGKEASHRLNRKLRRKGEATIRRARAGRYVITAGRVRITRNRGPVRKGALARPTRRRYRAEVRPGKRTRIQVEYGWITNPNVRRAPKGLVGVKGDSADPEALVYRRSKKLPRKGEILLAAPSKLLPAGLVSKVTASKRRGKLQVVSVKSVSVSEAVPAFEIDKEVKLDTVAAGPGPAAGTSAGSPSCDGPASFDAGWTLDEGLSIRHASSSLWPPQVELTLALRPRSWIGPKAAGASGSCSWEVVRWNVRGGIPTPVGPIPVSGSIPVSAAVSIQAISPIRVNVASTSVLDLALGRRNHFGLHQEGTNVSIDNELGASGDAFLSLTAALDVGLGVARSGDPHLSAGFGPTASWHAAGGCDVKLDLGSLSADAKVGSLEPGTPSWTPSSIPLWEGCRASDGSGGGDDGDAQPTFKAVSAGSLHTCAIRGDDTIACWGSNLHNQATPPGGTFKAVSAGGDHTCAIRSDETIECWGSNASGQATPPSGTFKAVSAGASHTCAIRGDDTIACWGSNLFGQATPPSGTFKAVSAGNLHTCAIRSDETIDCWGDNLHNQATPPSGTFKAVSAGNLHNCAIRSDDAITCWGYNFFDQTSPPSGAFKAVSAGENHTCAIRSDETIECWGLNASGQATPPSGA